MLSGRVLKMLYGLIKLCTVLYSFKISFLLIKLYIQLFFTIFIFLNTKNLKSYDVVNLTD
jgi:hypothetical protein